MVKVNFANPYRSMVLWFERFFCNPVEPLIRGCGLEEFVSFSVFSFQSQWVALESSSG